MKVLVTGGAGYVGGACRRPSRRARARRARASTRCCTGRRTSPSGSRARVSSSIRGDIRDAHARAHRRWRAPTRSSTSPRSSATPPARATPSCRSEVNVEGTRARRADAQAAGVERFVFASTCSNYGRMADPTVPIDEDGELRSGVALRRAEGRDRAGLLERRAGDFAPTCLRFATVYGVAPRMRFDLTVNEFTRDLWADRDLEVFGEQFWRPYVHVRDAGRAVRTVLEPPRERGRAARSSTSATRARTTASSTSSRRSATRLGRGDVSYVHRDEDPRDYKVSFDKIRAELGFEPQMTVPDGIGEIIAGLEEGRFGDPFDAPLPEHPADDGWRRSRSSTSGSTRTTSSAVADDAALGLADDGPARSQEFEAAFAEHLGVRHARRASSSCTAALHLAYLAAGVGPGRRGDRPGDHLRGHRGRGRSTAARRRCSRTSSARTTCRSTPTDVARRITPRTKAVCAVHFAGYPGAGRRAARALRRERGIALIEDAAHAPSATSHGARKLGTSGLAGAFCFFSNKVLPCGEGGLLATDDDEVAEHGPQRCARTRMTTGTWDRHRGHRPATTWSDVGFNYRLDEPRAALLTVAPGRPRGRHRDARARARAPLPRACWPTCDGRDRPLRGRGGRRVVLLRDAGGGRRPRAARRRCAS